MTVASRNAPIDLEVPAGLKGVRVAPTAIGDVLGDLGVFHYRGVDATELAGEKSFEQVWQFVLEGEMTAGFQAEATAARSVSIDADALSGLGACILEWGAARGCRPWVDISPAQLRADVIAVGAAVPTLVAVLHRSANGEDAVSPRDDLGHVANYLYMCTGEVPQTDVAAALEQYLVLTIDHGFNGSTFAARVVASAGADIASCISAALASLGGPLHGGAPSRALALLDELDGVADIDAHLRRKVLAGERLMGFGHAVYTTEDPRSRRLGELAAALAPERHARAKEVEEAAIRVLEEVKPGRALRTNVEFYAALVMEAVGLPPELFTPTFACARVVGWTAHILEQTQDNRIYRPSARYVGRKLV